MGVVPVDVKWPEQCLGCAKHWELLLGRSKCTVWGVDWRFHLWVLSAAHQVVVEATFVLVCIVPCVLFKVCSCTKDGLASWKWLF